MVCRFAAARSSLKEPVTCVVWSAVFFFYSKTNPTEHTLAAILGSRAPAEIGSAPMRSRRRCQHNADELRAREFASGRFGEVGNDRSKRGA